MAKRASPPRSRGSNCAERAGISSISSRVSSDQNGAKRLRGNLFSMKARVGRDGLDDLLHARTGRPERLCSPAPSYLAPDTVGITNRPNHAIARDIAVKRSQDVVHRGKVNRWLLRPQRLLGYQCYGVPAQNSMPRIV